MHAFSILFIALVAAVLPPLQEVNDCHSTHASFNSGTPILARDGAHAVETFKSFETHSAACDWVWSRDEHDPDGVLALRRVLRVFERLAPVINLQVGGRIIGTTGEHPLYAEGRGWVPAIELQIGDRVRLMGEGWLAVEGIADSGRVEAVYNLEIEDDHTYFVGCTEWGFSVWAHNAYTGVFQKLKNGLESRT